MSARPADRDTMEGFLRDLSVRLTRLERRSYPRGGGGTGGGATGPTGPTGPQGIPGPTGPTGPAGSGGTGAAQEVAVSNTDPWTGDPALELWFDPDAATDPFQSINEVWIGTDPPTDGNVELWFDPDAIL